MTNKYELKVLKHLRSDDTWVVYFSDLVAKKHTSLTVFRYDIGRCILDCLEKVKWPADIKVDTDLVAG